MVYGKEGIKVRQSKGEKAFYIINYIVLAIIGLITIYPLVYVFSASISEADAVITGKVLLFPKNIDFSAYQKVLEEKGIWTAYGNTIYYTAVGTLVNILITICGAYPLSKKRLMGRSFISFMIALTMWFNAGMIPFYLTLKGLNILNTRFAIIFAFACTTFNVILLRTFFQSIPDSLEEAATVDGANDLQILRKIYLPLSKPAIATVGLFYGIGRWNGYFWSMIILRDESKIPLQVLLKKLIVEMTASSEYINAVDTFTYSGETIMYATIIVSLIPVIIIYPYIQKYFVKGVMIGSVKG
jgi:putative aldouronate transport system permease protein